jgi:hypothetical protein
MDATLTMHSLTPQQMALLQPQFMMAACSPRLFARAPPGDRRLLDEALSDWRRVMDAYLQPCGECTETK